MVQLQKKHSAFKENGLQLFGLSYDSVKTLASFAATAKTPITFPLLSDPGSKTIKLLDLEFKRGLPHPGTFIIGADGLVKGKMFKEDFKKRHSVEEILAKAIKVCPVKADAIKK